MAPNAAAAGKALAKLATLAGPAAVGVLTQLAKNPEVGKKVQGQVEELFRHRGNSPEDMLETIAVLREQVEYLADSADDQAEVDRAQGWQKQLEQCERAARLVSAPGSSRKQRRTLAQKIGDLRSDILEAFLVEQDEDSRGEVGPPA